MKKTWLAITVLISIAMGFSSAQAEDPVPAVQIATGCAEVILQDTPLPAVAQALSRESGIEIRLRTSLIGEFITDQLSSKDCSGAVLNLLQDFSMMEFWGDDGQLVAVQLLSRKQAWSPEAAPQEASVSLVSTSVETEQPPTQMAETLNKYQVKALIDVAQGKLSPEEVMSNPLYEPHFKKAGLIELEDWKDKKKLKILRRHALRAWMKQHRQARKSR